MTNVGIVGHAADKFTAATEAKAREIIRRLLQPADVVLVSGHCPIGGIDIWAEEEYEALPDRTSRPDAIIHAAAGWGWAQYFKPRNERIGQDSHVLHNIVVRRYPDGYTGMLWDICYHCKSRSHVKSGGCWTARYAKSLGKPAYWHMI